MADLIRQRDEDQYIRYDCVVTYADKDAGTFDNFLPE